MHRHSVSRLGGVAIFIGLCTAYLAESYSNSLPTDLTVRLIVCSLPAFGFGLLEDLTRQAGIWARLIATMFSAALAFWLLDGMLNRVDIPLVDKFLAIAPFASLLLTMIAAGGVAHAVNIIDGYNGLTSSFAIAAFVSMGIIASNVDDPDMARLCFIAAGSVAGFMVWNFPFGRIFLGDSGAYLIGFLLAEFSILIVYRHPEVSAWSMLLIMLYPVWETLFSILRRARHGSRRIMQPDAVHLHQLVNRRMVRLFGRSHESRHLVLRNSMTSVYFWPLFLLSMVPAIVFAGQPVILIGFAILFIVSYCFFYLSIVRFKVPRWFVISRSLG